MPKRVLIVAGRMHYGGIESMIMNVFRFTDREQVVFDFMLNYEEPGAFDDEIRGYGGKIFIMPRLFLKNTFQYIKAVNHFFKTHKEYSIVHGHLTSVGVIYLTIAKIHGVKTKIIHAHTTSIRRRLKWAVERILMLPLRFCSDYYFACSEGAAAYCFGKNILNNPNYHTIRNGIVARDFIFDERLRETKRIALHLEGKFVIGNVGRFVEPKNHSRMIDIFGEVYARNKNAVLLLVGDGPLMSKTKEKVKESGLEDAVLFLGQRADTRDLLMAMDVFFLPSLYEGFPVSLVEAQGAGLFCVVSDAVTKATDLTGHCEYVPLSKNSSLWADVLLKFQDGYERKNTAGEIEKAGYDMRQQAKWLTDFYLSH